MNELLQIKISQELLQELLHKYQADRNLYIVINADGSHYVST